MDRIIYFKVDKEERGSTREVQNTATVLEEHEGYVVAEFINYDTGEKEVANFNDGEYSEFPYFDNQN